ncbi:MAG TPA: hypothetical protein VN600_10575 [Gemmatimonadaceae bacterium]|nr:hypothetical protein [Gemmatimonadaceae bacterium]
MSRPRPRRPLGSLAGVVVAIGSMAACHATNPSPARTTTVPALSAEPLAEPPVAATTRADTAHAAPEQMMTLTGDWDVRLALEEIAKTAGYSLIVSPAVPARKVRLSIVNAPASQALAAVLETAQLTLEPTRGPKPPWNPSVVFYQVPVNVDSLSADAIMKRFGVSRDIANLIVTGRHPE